MATTNGGGERKRGGTLVFFGALAGSTRRDAERFARARGFKIASTLRETIDVVVLGEGEPLAQVRARLAAEFDERSRGAFERGSLELVSESEFFRRAARETSDAGADFDAETVPPAPGSGATPAAVAELVGVSIQAIRRWRRRGLLAPLVEEDRLPTFAPREILVAKRLAFLLSTGLSEEFVERRVAAFRASAANASSETGETGARPDVGEIILRSTLSSDGRDVLLGGESGPVDFRGQRRFDFGALPTDGAFETPAFPALLSEAEERILTAERLAEWNAANGLDATNPSAPPAFLSLFGTAPEQADLERVAPTSDSFETAFETTSPPVPTRPEPIRDVGRAPFAEPVPAPPAQTPPAARSPLDESTTPPSFALPKAARERWRAATNRRVLRLCETAWNLERDGYWEEAARTYRSAALAGGLDAGVSFRLGRLLFLLGDFSAARERFYAALELDENYLDARFELGRTFVELGEFADAEAAFRGVVEERPNDAPARLELGKLYLRTNRRRAALESLRIAADRLDDPKLVDDVRRLIAAVEGPASLGREYVGRE